MRIISGRFRGRKIKMPKGIRPTQDKTRKALFDILGNIKGDSFLDLYSGSGAVGLEALSAGVRNAVFVEKSRECIKVIEENLMNLGVMDERSRGLSGIEIIHSDAIEAIKVLNKKMSEKEEHIREKSNLSKFLLFGAPRFGTNIVLTIVDFALLTLYSIGFDLPAWQIFLATSLGKLSIAASQFLFGWISDIKYTKWGRRKPYLIAISPLIGISFVFLLTDNNNLLNGLTMSFTCCKVAAF